MKLTIVRDGGLIYLDCDEAEDEDGNRVNSYGVPIDDDSHFAGFFRTEEDAREWAKSHGHTIAEDGAL